MDVLEQEHRRAAHSQRLDEDARRKEERLSIRDRSLAADAEEHFELRCVLLRSRRPCELCDRCSELGPRFGGLVAVEDHCRLLHELGEGAVGRARPVRRRATAKNTCPLVGDERGQLDAEPRLPDPRRPEHGGELSAALLDHPLPDSGQHAELTLATDHGNRGRGTLADLGRRPHREPGRDGRALALREHRLRGSVLDDVPGRDVGLLSDDDGSGRRRRLETRRRVHDVSGHHRLTVIGPRVELDDRFARVHCDPHLNVVLFGPVSDGEGGADGSLRIVPVRRRRAEHPHDRVADELLDTSAEALQPRPHLLVVRRQECTHVLRVERFGTLRGPHEVDEEDRDDPSLLSDSSGLAERSAARVAELRAVRVFLAAACAGRHEGEH